MVLPLLSQHKRAIYFIFISSLLFFVQASVFAQAVNVPFSGTITTTNCSGSVYDHGGATGSYSNGANGTLIINPGGIVTLNFTQFSTESCCDRLYIYDGINTSAPLIGSYRGSGLPGGGTITGTGNGLTLQFTSDGSVTSSGFAATWGGSSTALPTASMQAPPTSVPFNAAIQFTSTSTNANSYLWNFGDGQTSTDENPVHYYTSSGSKNVQLIASNCLGSDTSTISTLNVQTAPAGSVSTDTVKMSLACGTSGSTSYTISNQGAGNLTFNLDLGINPSYLNFVDNMESSTSTSFVDLNNTNTVNFLSAGAPQGNAYMSLQSNNYYNPMVANISEVQPTSVSYFVKSDQYGNYHGEFGLGSGDIFNKELLFYSVFRYGDIRLYHRNSAGFWSFFNFPQTDGTWYHIELKNIDWTARTYDIYVDNVLQVSTAQMLSTTLTGISFMYFNNSSFNASGLDAVTLGGLNANSIFSYNPQFGSLGNGSSNTIFVNANSAGLNAGTYYFDFLISSNDTALNGKLLPIELEVTGTADLLASKFCTNFGTGFTGVDYTDSVMLTNTGCDTLNFDSIVSSNPGLNTTLVSLNLAPGDTSYAHFSFRTSVVGSIADTVYFLGSDTNFAYCFTGTFNGAPIISASPSSFVVNHTGCTDSASFQFVLSNTGLDTLSWTSSGTFSTTYMDDFENTSQFNSSIWQTVGSGVVLNGTCGSIAGSNSATFSGTTDRFMITKPLDLTNTSTFSYTFMRGGSCGSPSSGDRIYLEYSLDGGNSWLYIDAPYLSNFNANRITINIPANAQTSNVQLRFDQRFYYIYGDVWIIDDFEIETNLSNTLHLTPTSGSIAVNNSDTITTYIDVNGLTTGVYNLNAYVGSNDPNTPILTIPVTLNLTGVADLESNVSCIDLDTVLENSVLTDSVLVWNQGCGDFIFNSLSNSNAALSIGANPNNLAPQDSAYITYTYSPTAIGAFIDTIVISNGMGNVTNICLSGQVIGAPTVSVLPDSIYLSLLNCSDSVQFNFTIANTGLGDLNYQINSRAALSFTDDFETTPLNTNFWASGNNYAVGSNCGVIAGNNSVSFNGTGIRHLTSVPLDLTNGATITFEARDRGTCETPDGGEGLYVQYSLDGGASFSNAHYHFSAGISTNLVSVTMPAASYSPNTIIRIAQTSNSGSGYDNWVIDNFSIQGNTGVSNNDISFSIDSGTVVVGATDSILATINLQGYNTGIHSFIVSISSNDPLNPNVNIPVVLDYQGTPNAQLVQTGCLSYLGIQQGAIAIDTTFITNTGCDTLEVLASSSSSGLFGALNLPLLIAPGDTQLVEVSFSPINVGTFIDTVVFQTNDTSLFACVGGTAVGAPLLSLPKDTLSFSLNKCRIIGNETFRIENQGAGALTFDLSIGGFQAGSKILYTSTSAVTNHSFTNLPAATANDTLEIEVILHGDFDEFGERASMYIDGSYYGNVPDNNLNYINDTIRYTLFGNNVVNFTSDGALNIDLYNTTSVDGGAGSFHEVRIKLTSQVNWVSIVGATNGSIASGAATNKNFLFNAAGLAVGQYNTNLNITTNAPGAGASTVVPITLNVISEPVIALTDTCLIFPLTLVGDTATKTFSIYNPGCEILNVTSNIVTSNLFKLTSPSAGVSAVQVDDSLHYTIQFVPNATGNFSASLIINNNDTLQNICLIANAGAIPQAQFTFTEENPCTGEFNFFNNSSFNPTNSFWNFGDGNTSTQLNPTHSFSKPGNYKVTLRVSNTYGFDTISYTVTANPFYVAFDASADTVELSSSTVNFYDSSTVATNWNWNFGDGSTDVAQNPSHTYSSQGTFIVTLTATDARGCTATFTKTIVVRNTIGLTENSLRDFASVYPNPASTTVFVELKQVNSSAQVYLISANGKLVKKQVIEGDTPLNVNDLPVGMYILQFFDETQTYRGSEKLLIKR